MRDQVIVRVAAKLFIPFILLFALYVQFHGDYGPGGGFQAGVIAAAALILYALVYGVDAAKRVAHPTLLQSCAAIGILIYAGTGVVALLLGGQYLDYNLLSHDHVHGQERGIFWVEAGVGLAVAAVMATTFFVFAGRKDA